MKPREYVMSTHVRGNDGAEQPRYKIVEPEMERAATLLQYRQEIRHLLGLRNAIVRAHSTAKMAVSREDAGMEGYEAAERDFLLALDALHDRAVSAARAHAWRAAQ